MTTSDIVITGLIVLFTIYCAYHLFKFIGEEEEREKKNVEAQKEYKIKQEEAEYNNKIKQKDLIDMKIKNDVDNCMKNYDAALKEAEGKLESLRVYQDSYIKSGVVELEIKYFYDDKKELWLSIDNGTNLIRHKDISSVKIERIGNLGRTFCYTKDYFYKEVYNFFYHVHHNLDTYYRGIDIPKYPQFCTPKYSIITITTLSGDKVNLRCFPKKETDAIEAIVNLNEFKWNSVDKINLGIGE